MKRLTRVLALVLTLLLLPSLGLAKDKLTPYKPVRGTALEGATLLSAPRADAGFVADLSEGDELEVEVVGLSWCKVRAGGRDGWVNTEKVRFSTSVDDSEKFAIIMAKNGKLTLRQKDTTKSKAIGRYSNGNICAVVQTDKNYTRVLIDGKEGYLLTAHLKMVSSEESEGTGRIIWPQETKKKVTVRMRWSEKAGNNTVLQLPVDTELVVLSEGSDFTRVEYLGRVGYIMNKYLSVEKAVKPAATPAPTETPADENSDEEGLDGAADETAAEPSAPPVAPVAPVQPSQTPAAPAASVQPTQTPATGNEIPDDENIDGLENGEPLPDDEELPEGE